MVERMLKRSYLQSVCRSLELIRLAIKKTTDPLLIATAALPFLHFSSSSPLTDLEIALSRRIWKECSGELLLLAFNIISPH